jgi:hypothetical protein
MTVHTDAKLSLHGYKEWRRSLVALPVGTAVEWVVGYTGITLDTTIKPGQLFKITKVRAPFGGPNECMADQVYEMVLVSKSGKEFKKRAQWNVEGIASKLHHGQCKLAQQ